MAMRSEYSDRLELSIPPHQNQPIWGDDPMKGEFYGNRVFRRVVTLFIRNLLCVSRDSSIPISIPIPETLGLLPNAVEPMFIVLARLTFHYGFKPTSSGFHIRQISKPNVIFISPDIPTSDIIPLPTHSFSRGDSF